MHSGSFAAAAWPAAGSNPVVTTYIAFTSDTEKVAAVTFTTCFL